MECLKKKRKKENLKKSIESLSQLHNRKNMYYKRNFPNEQMKFQMSISASLRGWPVSFIEIDNYSSSITAFSVKSHRQTQGWRILRKLKTQDQIQEVTEISPTESWPNKGINKYNRAPSGGIPDTRIHTYSLRQSEYLVRTRADRQRKSKWRRENHRTWTQTIISSTVFNCVQVDVTWATETIIPHKTRQRQ